MIFYISMFEQLKRTIYRIKKMNLLENLIKWAQMQQGRISFEPQRLNLNDIIV